MRRHVSIVVVLLHLLLLLGVVASGNAHEDDYDDERHQHETPTTTITFRRHLHTIWSTVCDTDAWCAAWLESSGATKDIDAQALAPPGWSFAAEELYQEMFPGNNDTSMAVVDRHDMNMEEQTQTERDHAALIHLQRVLTLHALFRPVAFLGSCAGIGEQLVYNSVLRTTRCACTYSHGCPAFTQSWNIYLSPAATKPLLVGQADSAQSIVIACTILASVLVGLLLLSVVMSFIAPGEAVALVTTAIPSQHAVAPSNTVALLHHPHPHRS